MRGLIRDLTAHARGASVGITSTLQAEADWGAFLSQNCGPAERRLVMASGRLVILGRRERGTLRHLTTPWTDMGSCKKAGSCASSPARPPTECPRAAEQENDLQGNHQSESGESAHHGARGAPRRLWGRGFLIAHGPSRLLPDAFDGQERVR